MMRKSICVISVVLFVFSLLCVSACRRGAVKEEEQGITTPKSEGVVEDELSEARRKVEEMRKQPGIKLSPIYFAFDDFSLTEEAKETLIENAAWSLNNPQKKVVIGGNCDERGSNEYNLALGQRRANSAQKYLVNLGVPASQLSTISYGEEKPVDSGHNEEAWTKNRRDEFVTK
jgi:peptidoglycan-associated lipoprotein